MFCVVKLITISVLMYVVCSVMVWVVQCFEPLGRSKAACVLVHVCWVVKLISLYFDVCYVLLN